MQTRICKKHRGEGRNIVVSLLKDLSADFGQAWYRCPECHENLAKEATEVLPFDEKGATPEDSVLVSQRKAKEELGEVASGAILTETPEPMEPSPSEAEERAQKQAERAKEMDK